MSMQEPQFWALNPDKYCAPDKNGANKVSEAAYEALSLRPHHLYRNTTLELPYGGLQVEVTHELSQGPGDTEDTATHGLQVTVAPGFAGVSGSVLTAVFDGFQTPPLVQVNGRERDGEAATVLARGMAEFAIGLAAQTDADRSHAGLSPKVRALHDELAQFVDASEARSLAHTALALDGVTVEFAREEQRTITTQSVAARFAATALSKDQNRPVTVREDRSLDPADYLIIHDGQLIRLRSEEVFTQVQGTALDQHRQFTQYIQYGRIDPMAEALAIEKELEVKEVGMPKITYAADGKQRTASMYELRRFVKYLTFGRSD